MGWLRGLPPRSLRCPSGLGQGRAPWLPGCSQAWLGWGHGRPRARGQGLRAPPSQAEPGTRLCWGQRPDPGRASWGWLQGPRPCGLDAGGSREWTSPQPVGNWGPALWPPPGLVPGRGGGRGRPHCTCPTVPKGPSGTGPCRSGKGPPPRASVSSPAAGRVTPNSQTLAGGSHRGPPPAFLVASGGTPRWAVGGRRSGAGLAGQPPPGCGLRGRPGRSRGGPAGFVPGGRRAQMGQRCARARPPPHTGLPAGAARVPSAAGGTGLSLLGWPGTVPWAFSRTGPWQSLTAAGPTGPFGAWRKWGDRTPGPPHPRAPPGGAAPAPAPSRAGPPGTGPGSRSLGHRVEGVLVTEGPRCAPEHGPLTLLGSTPPPVAPTHRPVGSFQNLNRAVSFGSCPCPCASAGTLPAQPAHVGRGPSLPGTRHAGSRVPRVSPPRAPAPRSPASSRLSQLPLRPGRRGHTHAPSVSWSPQAVAPAAPTPPGARDEGGGGGQGAQAAGRGRSGCSTPPRRPAAWPRPFLSRPQFPGAERSEAGTAGVKRAPAPAPPSRPLWAWTSPNPRRLPEGCREEHPGAGPCTARLLLLRPHPAPRAGGS